MKRTVGIGPDRAVKARAMICRTVLSGIFCAAVLMMAGCNRVSQFRPVLFPPPPHPYYLAQLSNPSFFQARFNTHAGEMPKSSDQYKFLIDLSGRHYSIEIKPVE